MFERSIPKRVAPSCAAAAFLLSVAAIATTLPAQEVKLRDGTVHYGAVRQDKDGTTSIATRAGAVRVASADVAEIRSRSSLRAAFRRLVAKHGDSAFGHLELARIARERALDAEMWRELDAVIEAGLSGAATRRRYGALVSEIGRGMIDASVDAKTQVRTLLRGISQLERDARVRATEAALAQLTDGEPELRKQARRGSSPMRRLTALRAIVQREEQAEAKRTDNWRFALRAAIVDPSETVRDGAAEIAAGDAPAAIDYLVPGLFATNPHLQLRTAELFGALANEAAAPHLIRAGQLAAAPAGSGTNATRAYIAVLRQQAYIRDFDVEVASAAFIADPKISVLQSGVVLDATVASVTSMPARRIRSLRRALRSLAGPGAGDPGDDPTLWSEWWRRRQPTR